MSGTVSIETNDIECNYLESSSNEITGFEPQRELSAPHFAPRYCGLASPAVRQRRQ